MAGTSPLKQKGPCLRDALSLGPIGAFVPGLNLSIKSYVLHRAGCCHRNILFEEAAFYSMYRDPVRKDVPSIARTWKQPRYPSTDE